MQPIFGLCNIYIYICIFSYQLFKFNNANIWNLKSLVEMSALIKLYCNSPKRCGNEYIMKIYRSPKVFGLIFVIYNKWSYVKEKECYHFSIRSKANLTGKK